MHRIEPNLILAIGFSLFMLLGGVDIPDAMPQENPVSSNQAGVIALAARRCPPDLSFLQPRMENALRYIKSSDFRNTMLESLQASIPKSIVQADGLEQQIVFLKQEIIRQEQKRAYAEKVAREGLSDPTQELKPCRHGEERSYCYAVDQYYVSIAANLANEAFLEGLQCFQREGVR